MVVTLKWSIFRQSPFFVASGYPTVLTLPLPQTLLSTLLNSRHSSQGQARWPCLCLQPPLGTRPTFAHHILRPHADPQTFLPKIPMTGSLVFFFLNISSLSHSSLDFYQNGQKWPLLSSQEFLNWEWPWPPEGILAMHGDISGCYNWEGDVLGV